jgi:hypothetical protein
MSLIFAPQGSVAPDALIADDTNIQWDGLLMGVGTFFGYKELTGWDDLPALDTSDAPRPNYNGDFAGRALSQGRIITFDMQIWGTFDTDGSFAELRREFLRRTQIQQEEIPLVIRQHGETMMVYARIIARTWPIKRPYFKGYPEASIQWKATDPNKYSVNEQVITLQPPVSIGGVDYTTGGGVDYATGGGVDYGTTVTGASAVINDGLSATPLRFEFVGPLSSPPFVHAPGNWDLGVDMDLAAGEVLAVDARLGTVTLGGVDRYYAINQQSDLPEDCVAEPGSTAVQFTPGSPGDTGYVRIFWRDAQM